MRLRDLSVLIAVTLPVAAPTIAAAEQAVVEEDADPTLMSLSGVLVSRTGEQLVIKDEAGVEHAFKVNPFTRYIWSESSSPSDLKPGARVRTDFDASGPQPVAISVWVLGTK